MNRRDFLIRTGLLSLAGWEGWENRIMGAEGRYAARYYTSLDHGRVRCELCPHQCVLKPSQTGICRARRNEKGHLFSLNYGQACAYNIDPIEKKPFFHFYPGSQALSIAAAGCNLRCRYCQNWEISQYAPDDVDSRPLSPTDIANDARRRQIPMVAFTYSEPTVFYEYMLDTADRCGQAGIKTCMISAGFIRKKPLQELCHTLSAVKIDLKSFRDDFYRQICGARLNEVLDALVTIRQSSAWLEIVYLIVPTLNDTPVELTDTARWIKANLGSDVPLHFSRFYPHFKLQNYPPTPVKTLETACQIAKAEGLHYVYAGNLPGNPLEHTVCPTCRAVLIRRYSHTVLENRIRRGKCPDCGHPIPGRWD
ncbi:MAG: AmmeMemoRadiSam system radical SAM enzyme [Candidatus Delongbacteria bacterium]|nr:AmmeMemoRadiSam system radical SAM enzyme [Candidatus Delongbacteria bacterium]